MSMSRKDFEAIAKALRDTRPIAARNGDGIDPVTRAHVTVDYAAQNLADVCTRSNPRFDRSRFLAACGVQS